MEKSTGVHSPLRWNIERRPDGSISICFGDHESAEACEFVEFVPRSQLDDALANRVGVRVDDAQKLCDQVNQMETKLARMRKLCASLFLQWLEYVIDDYDRMVGTYGKDHPETKQWYELLTQLMVTIEKTQKRK